MQPMYSGGSGSVQAEVSRADFLRSTYIHLAGAILAFAAISFAIGATGLGVGMLKWMGASRFIWLGILGAFMVVGWLASNMADNAESNNQQLAGLGLYVVAESVIFAPMFALANMVAPSAIPAAAFVTLLLCAGLTWTAFTTKSDFSFLGSALKIGGMCALGAIVAGAVFGFSMGIWFSAIMVAFAGACVLYDTGKIIHHYPTDRPAGAALHLFASIALMLWYVLRLLMQLSGRN